VFRQNCETHADLEPVHSTPLQQALYPAKPGVQFKLIAKGGVVLQAGLVVIAVAFASVMLALAKPVIDTTLSLFPDGEGATVSEEFIQANSR
jgi:hypothetical protein